MSNTVNMDDFFSKLKNHAANVDKTVKELEKEFAIPELFFGSKSRKDSAKKIIEKQIEGASAIKNQIQQMSVDTCRSISDSDELLEGVENVKRDMEDMREGLVKLGFLIVEEETEVSNSKGVNESDTSSEKENLPPPVEKTPSTPVMQTEKNSQLMATKQNDLLNNDDEENEQTRCVAGFLAALKVDIDDIVTPHITRKSIYHNKT